MVQDVVRKLDSPLADIKERAIKSLELKQRLGKLDQLESGIISRLLKILHSRESPSWDLLILRILEKSAESQTGLKDILKCKGLDTISRLEIKERDLELQKRFAALRLKLSTLDYVQPSANSKEMNSSEEVVVQQEGIIVWI